MEALERDEFLRLAWQKLVAGRLDRKRFVSGDEMGTNTSLTPLYGWAPTGKGAYYFEVPPNFKGST